MRNHKDRNRHGGEFVKKGLICKKLEVAKNITSEILVPEITLKVEKGQW